MATKKEWKRTAKQANEAAKYWMERYHEDTDEISGLMAERNEWQLSHEKVQKDADFYRKAAEDAPKLAGDLGLYALKYALEADALEDEVKALTKDRDHYKLNYTIASAERQEYIDMYFLELEEKSVLQEQLDAEAEESDLWQERYHTLVAERFVEALAEQAPTDTTDTE